MAQVLCLEEEYKYKGMRTMIRVLITGKPPVLSLFISYPGMHLFIKSRGSKPETTMSV